MCFNGKTMKEWRNYLKVKRMKRVFVLVVVSLFVVALVSSCKTADCPAYSEVEVEQGVDVQS